MSKLIKEVGEMLTEEVVLLKVVKKHGKIIIDRSRDTSNYEILGILIPFVDNLKDDLKNGLVGEEIDD